MLIVSCILFYTLSWFIQVAITTDHQMAAYVQQEVISYSFGGWMSKMKVLQIPCLVQVHFLFHTVEGVMASLRDGLR